MHPILKSLNDLEKMGSVRCGSVEEVAASVNEMIGWVDKKAVDKKADVRASALSGVLSFLSRPAGAVAMLGTGAAVAGVIGTIESRRLRGLHQQISKDLAKDPDIRQDPEKAKRVYGVMTRYAPGVASDPVVAKATVKSLMSMPESYLTYDIAQKLTEAEKEYDLTHGILAKIKKII